MHQLSMVSGSLLYVLNTSQEGFGIETSMCHHLESGSQTHYNLVLIKLIGQERVSKKSMRREG